MAKYTGEELIGERYGNIVVQGIVKPKPKSKALSKVKVKCDCGRVREYPAYRVRDGYYTACGDKKCKYLQPLKGKHQKRGVKPTKAKEKWVTAPSREELDWFQTYGKETGIYIRNRFVSDRSILMCFKNNRCQMNKTCLELNIPVYLFLQRITECELFRQYVEAFRQCLVEDVESVLLDAIFDKDVPDIKATEFFLKTRGGYNESSNLNISTETATANVIQVPLAVSVDEWQAQSDKIHKGKIIDVESE